MEGFVFEWCEEIVRATCDCFLCRTLTNRIRNNQARGLRILPIVWVRYSPRGRAHRVRRVREEEACTCPRCLFAIYSFHVQEVGQACACVLCTRVRNEIGR